ncbi:hypothetical protein PV325_005020, partial [Microctonus aethiopoides]
EFGSRRLSSAHDGWVRLTTVDSVEYGAFSDKPRIAEGCRVIEEDGACARKKGEFRIDYDGGETKVKFRRVYHGGRRKGNTGGESVIMPGRFPHGWMTWIISRTLEHVFEQTYLWIITWRVLSSITFVATLYCQSQIISSHGGQEEDIIVRFPKKNKNDTVPQDKKLPGSPR